MKLKDYERRRQLALAEVCPTLDPKLVRTLTLGIRNVQLTLNGFIFKRCTVQCKHAADWRLAYHQWFKRLFPGAWLYQGGSHIAVHASPPSDQALRYPKLLAGELENNQAGRLLFKIIEVKYESKN